jgi:hypothetical protein
MLATLQLKRESPQRTPKKKYLFASNLGWKEKNHLQVLHIFIMKCFIK